MPYWKAVLIAIDQLANAILGGFPDETLSSRSYRLSQRGKTFPANVIDAIFFWDRVGNKGHCELSFESEREARQLPPECNER